jgi:hypothetical protein
MLRVIEDRVLYPLTGHAVGVRVHFRSAGYAPLAQLVSTLQEAHVVVKEIAVAPGEDSSDTIHLRLKLPRRMKTLTLTSLVAELDEVKSVSLD